MTLVSDENTNGGTAPRTHGSSQSEAILSWYDGAVEALIQCPECGERWYAWLIAWRPGERTRTYALRKISSEWTERIGDLHRRAEESASGWSLKQKLFDQLGDVVNGFFSQPTPDIFVATTTDVLHERLRLKRVKPADLGEWSHPVDIEQVADQSEVVRQRLEGLADSSAPSVACQSP